jgi:hypothetical protein
LKAFVKVLLGKYFEDELTGLEEVELEGQEIDSWEGVRESIDP